MVGGYKRSAYGSVYLAVNRKLDGSSDILFWTCGGKEILC
jgi:hypothetical protein